MSTEWAIIRGSGIAAFALLSASVIWGLLVSSKLIARYVKAKPLTWFHESLGIGALLATLIHVLVISVHDFLDFSWAEILIPGRSDWRPLPTAFGTLAMYGLGVVVVSFYVRKWIGQRMWRAIHFGAFGVFLSSLVHGIQAGSDSTSPLVLGLYAGATIVIFGLVAHRLTPIGVEPPEPVS
jgi:methionine sulfoxide reductase heme-binding subunit